MSEPGSVYIINPNSSRSVSNVIERTLRDFAGAKVDMFRYLTTDDGPATIITDEDVIAAGHRVHHDTAAALSAPGAVIIGCFSDPGLVATRRGLSCPVIGMPAVSINTALTIADRFGTP